MITIWRLALHHKDMFSKGNVAAGRDFRSAANFQGLGSDLLLFLFAPPAGRDTVRVFASRDPAVAARIREAIQQLFPDGVPAGLIG